MKLRLRSLLLILILFSFQNLSAALDFKLSSDVKNNEICTGSTVNIYGLISGGTEPYEVTANYKGSSVNTIVNDNEFELIADVNASGYFTISVKDAINNEHIDSIQINTITNSLTADFTFVPTTPCSGEEVEFTPTVSNGEGKISFSWSSNNVEFSDKEIAKNTFISYGCNSTENFTLIMETWDENKCSRSVSKTITVTKQPELDFSDGNNDLFNQFNNCGNTPSASNPNFSIELVNESPDAACITSYSVDWGDGSTENNVSFPLSHTYNKLGAFALIVTGYSGSGCNGIFKTTVKNQSNPAVGVGTPGGTQGCEPKDFFFLLNNYENNPPQTSYFIDFGDGYSETWDYEDPLINDTIKHTYRRTSCPGSEFLLTVTAINTCKQTPATVGGITVWDTPKASIGIGSSSSKQSTTTICTDENVLLFNSSLAGNYGESCSDLTEYSWVIPDLDTIKTTDKTYQTVSFSTPGTYTIELYSRNPCGKSKDEVIIRVTDPPVANASITPNTGCVPLIVNTTNNSTGEFLNYSWTVAPNANYSFTAGSRTSKEPEITFTKAGTYTLTLEVNNNCQRSYKSFTMTVSDKPNIGLDEIPNYCNSASISPTFINTGGFVTSYNWTFTGGAPASSAKENPTNIVYASPGKHSIELSAVNSCGTSNNVIEFTIDQEAEVDVSDMEICNDISSIDLAALANHQISFLWSTNGSGSFGDASSSATNYDLSDEDKTRNQIEIYATATGAGVCGETRKTLNLDISQKPIVNAGSEFIACKNKTIPIESASASNYKSIQWKTLGDGSFNDQTLINPKYTPGAEETAKGIAKLYLEAEPIAPCTGIVADTLLLNLNDPPVVFAGDDQTICVENYIIPDSEVLNTSNFQWTHDGSGSFTDPTNLSAEYHSSEADNLKGYVNLILTASVSGCIPAIDSMKLNLPPRPSLITQPSTVICENSTFNLIAQAKNYSDLSLSSSGDGTFNDNKALNTTYYPSEKDIEKGTVTLYTSITGQVPCNSLLLDSTVIGITKLPTVTPMSDPIIGEDEYLNINFAGAENFESLQWTSDGTGTFTNKNGLITNYLPSIQDKLNETVEITLIANALSPCHLSSAGTSESFTLYIVPKPKAEAGENLKICEGSNFLMPAGHASAERYSELFWTSNSTGIISNINTLTPGYSPTIDDIYNREVTLYLNARGEAPIEEIISIDSMKVLIIHNAEIGLMPADTMCEDDSYSPVKDIDSDVAVYNWSSSSLTGYFDNPTSPNPEFNPDAEDILNGSVDIFVTVNSNTPCITDNNSTTKLQILHNPEPNFEFTPEMGCGPLSVNFTNRSEGEELNYNWSFGDFTQSEDLNPSMIVFEPGIIADTSYYVTLEASNRCGSIEEVKSVIVQSSPLSRFAMMPSWGCSPVTILFQNNSLGIPTTYEWNWGDGSAISTIQEPRGHIYTTDEENSEYTVQLISENHCGIDTIRKVVTVFPNTVEAFFEADTNIGCAPLEINFTNFSRGSAGSEPFLEWSWNFGDGNVSDSKNPTHIFNTPGTYKVSVFVHDSCAYDTASTIIRVMGGQKLEIITSAEDACIGDSILFSPQNIDLSKVGNLLWDFGDGNTSNLTTINYAYQQSDNFEASLSTRDIETGCIAKTSLPINIHPLPSSSFTLTDSIGCQPLKVEFQNQTTEANYHVWNFDDGSSSITMDPTHIFEAPGNFTVRLSATNGFGCNDTARKNIVVNPIPLSSFQTSSEQSCSYPVSVDLTNTSEYYDANKWILPNPGELSSIDAKINLKEAGTYPIQLITYNKFGCTDTALYAYNVYETPIPNFKVDNVIGCDPYTIQFKNTTDFGKTYLWTFNHSDTSHATQPIYTFRDPGVYSVGMIAIGGGGCTDSIFKDAYITVNPSPEANYDHEPVNESDTIEFFNLSDGYESSIWYFGDGETSAETDPIHRYRSDSTYLAALVVINEYACTDTSIQEIIVDFKTSIYLPNAISPNNMAEGVRLFTPVGVGLSSFHLVIYDTWGNKIWETTKVESGSPVESWDGKDKNGNELPSDTYYWHIKEASFKNGEHYSGTRYGVINVIK